MRAIDAEKAIEVAQIKYNDWVLAMAAADGRREINLCFKKQELFKAVKAVLDCVPTITLPDHFPDPTKMVQGRTNEPLTLEQLREMDGEPVWVQTPGIPKYGRWVIVAGVDTKYGQRTLYCQGDYTCHNYGRDLIAYRRPPEGEADE